MMQHPDLEYAQWSEDLDRTIEAFNVQGSHVYNPGDWEATRTPADEVAVFDENGRLQIVLDVESEPHAFDEWLAHVESLAVDAA